MELTWTRNDREIWYLTAIVLVSSALSLHLITLTIFFGLFDILTAVIPPFELFEIILMPIFDIFLAVLPLLPHLLGFVYAKRTGNGRGSYYFALAVSFVLSHYSFSYYDITGHGVVNPIWYEEIAFLSVTLLVPTFHAYLRYDGDIREIVLLVLIYAPWVQLIRMGIAYLSLI